MPKLKIFLQLYDIKKNIYKLLEIWKVMVYNLDTKKEELIMADFIKQIEMVFTDLWNYFYVFLCNLWDENVNEDWIVKDN